MGGELTRAAIAAQPEWLRQVPTDVRLPAGRVVATGCGTSFHAAQTAGAAVLALEALAHGIDADVLVAVSHEATTWATMEALRRFEGERWLVTGARDVAGYDRVVVVTPELERSMCHTASYTCAVAALAALRGEDVSWLPDAVAAALEEREEPSAHERWVIAGAGAAWPTAQEAALKLREGAHVAAEAHHTEQLLHGHLAAVDESVRAFVLDGPGVLGERARDAVRALEIIGCHTTLVPTRHPVVDIVRFQLLTVDLAELRGVDPDVIRRDEERWARAREAYR